MEVSISRRTPYTSGTAATLKAFVTLKVETPTFSVEIRDCKYHVGETGDWIQLPSRSYEDRETGETKYTNTVHLPDRDEYIKFQQGGKHEIRKALDPSYANQEKAAEENLAPERAQVAPPQANPAPKNLSQRTETYDDIPF